MSDAGRVRDDYVVLYAKVEIAHESLMNLGPFFRYNMMWTVQIIFHVPEVDWWLGSLVDRYLFVGTWVLVGLPYHHC